MLMTDFDAVRFGLMLGATGAVILIARFRGPYVEELLRDFVDLFMGGPKAPSHPVPGDDSAVLKKRRGQRQ